MICDRCHKDKSDVEVVIDPYNKDVNDTIIEMALCDECYTERCDDI